MNGSSDLLWSSIPMDDHILVIDTSIVVVELHSLCVAAIFVHMFRVVYSYHIGPICLMRTYERVSTAYSVAAIRWHEQS